MLYFIRMLFYTNIRKRDVKDEFYQVKNSKEIDILKASKGIRPCNMYRRVISSGILVNLLLFAFHVPEPLPYFWKCNPQKAIVLEVSFIFYMSQNGSKRDKRRTPYNQGNETDLVISVGNISDHSLPFPFFTRPFISPSAHHHRRDPSGTEVSRLADIDGTSVSDETAIYAMILRKNTRL